MPTAIAGHMVTPTVFDDDVVTPETPSRSECCHLAQQVVFPEFSSLWIACAILLARHVGVPRDFASSTEAASACWTFDLRIAICFVWICRYTFKATVVGTFPHSVAVLA